MAINRTEWLSIEENDQNVPAQPLFLKLILITSFEYFRSHRILSKNCLSLILLQGNDRISIQYVFSVFWSWSTIADNMIGLFNVHDGISFDIADQISLNITYWISLEYFLIGCRFGKMTTGDLVVGGCTQIP